MKNISPLGAVIITIAVTAWNKRPKDQRDKTVIKKFMLAKTVRETGRGLDYIFMMIENQDFVTVTEVTNPIPINPLITGLLYYFFPSSIMNRRKMSAIINGEVADYFKSKFENGYLEEIPMPNLHLDTDLVLERRILSEDGKMSVKGPR